MVTAIPLCIRQLLSCYRCSREHTAHKAKNICCLAFYTKFADLCSGQLQFSPGTFSNTLCCNDTKQSYAMQTKFTTVQESQRKKRSDESTLKMHVLLGRSSRQ